MTNIFLELHKDGWSDAYQISIGTEGSGYRLLGPKFNGSSVPLRRKQLTKRDAEQLIHYAKMVPEGA